MAAQPAAAGDAMAEAASPARRFDLPAQPLASALEAFGGLTGYSVLVSSQLMEGRQAHEVRGEFQPNEALFKLLAGTSLAARYVGRNAFTLVPVWPEAADQESAAQAEPGPSATRFSATPFAAVLQQSITRQLCREQPRLFGRYRIGLQMWVNADGAVSRVSVLESSGVRTQDEAVSADLAALVLDSAPPPDLAQPVTLLLTPRLNPAQDCRAVSGATHGRGR